ncbi:MAG: amidohydrolase [Zetaproteobacteria bacterium CG12_big_fil_rev_8_21_14_0_65_54_13]|nr:MAG: N-acyl-L-amino acid amidohydrolase [Zetaproteobacteria bacterium CG23_combo_of_CG06-09_8_20_14_all_54_7]PIW47962.1 MAG: amidohydrolase [Zetaproteobacteria bacterium CG12_big_fil_rev_8_21_14_0_65_54_13]PIX54702.1 MAG: amidohydrolase [Zetaproteobacteria bacterium CG_4_10_14_3_um_filter_54_28]PJA30961.1 MAG: amidohydrolase [Zetaproteobacteria bacterium CG_4_9_14_3_um_filter_54_145]
MALMKQDRDETITARLNRTIDALMPAVIDIRRQLHQQPELSGREKETAAMVAARCRDLGLAVREGIGGYGLLATLVVDDALPWLAFRADMDALPIQESSPVRNYSSQVDGISHSCGHDAHTAILLGSMQAICQLKDQLKHNILFVFQPAEETCVGAAAMLREKLFGDIKPAQIYALHVYPYLPAGSIGLREGAMCAAADMFDVEIKGHGGHAARPHECTDVVLIAAQIIQALHHIVGRKVNPLHPAVLTIGQIHGGHAGNVIPGSISLSGTIRSLHPEVHEEIRTRMDQIIRQTAEAWGATATFTLRQATPVLINDTKLLRRAATLFKQFTPDVNLIEILEPSMGGEDFAEFLYDIPGCLFRLGTGGSPETRYPLHHPCFDIDESSMKSGIAVFTALALQ